MTPTARTRERLVIMMLLLVFVAAAAVATASPGRGATSNVGPATVTASPTVGLSDGQVVSIHAEAPEGSRIFEIRARLCRHNVGIDNSTEFGFQGDECPVAAIGAGQFDEGFEPPGETRVVDLSFAVGMGAITWVNELGFVNELECGPGHPCDLVVQLQLPGETVYATFPMLIGEGAEPAPPPAPDAAPPPPAPPEGGEAEGEPLPAGLADLAPADAKGTGTASGTATAGTGADAGAKANAASSDGADAELASATTSVISPPDASRALRVFSGGIAGLVGGALIVWIVIRARRHMGMAGAS